MIPSFKQGGSGLYWGYPLPERSFLKEGPGYGTTYINGEYRGDSEIGQLMHDFNCTRAADMHLALMADRAHYLKDDPKGASEMCKIMEDLKNEGRLEGMLEGRKEGMLETARRMLAAGKYALEEIAELVGLPLEEVKALQAGQGA